MRPLSCWLFGFGCLALAACTESAPVANGAPLVATTAQGPSRTPPKALVHDFGTIRHGESRQHDFVLDLRTALGEGWYAAGTHVDCSCARTEIWLRSRDGEERRVEILGPGSAPKEGEVLVVRTILDTQRREPIDTKVLESRAVVVLQHVDSRDPNQRAPWTLQFRFQVDSPVRVRPVAIVDFGRVAPSKPGEQTLTLSSDVEGREIRFREPISEDPRVRCTIEKGNGFTLLRVTFAPQKGDVGSLRSLIQIGTDLDPPYQVHLGVTATLAPDLEAIPFPKLSLRADLGVPQPPERAQSQYVMVTDHDATRPAAFVVARLVDDQGKDASDHFAVTLEPVPDEPRSCRVHVRWTGAATVEFRGQLVLAKDPVHGPFLPIELVALNDK